MVKTGKPALQGERKASGSSVESSLAYPNASLKVSPCPPSSQAKSKLNRFKITASILKQCCSTASSRPPEASNGLPNGLLALVSDESSSEKSSQRRNFPKDITDFGLFQKRHLGSNEATSGAGEISRKIYSLSEEAGESVGSDGEEQDKEHTARSKDEKGLQEMEKKEEATENEAPNQKSEQDGGEKETKDKDKESASCSDSVTDGCFSGSSREDA